MADPFSAVLLDLRLTGTFFCNSEFGSPWAVEIPERDFASFHFVTSGECWLQPVRRGKRFEAVRLGEGDLILLARSPRHVFSSEKRRQGTHIDALPSHAISQTASTLRMGNGGSWLVVCGGVRLESLVGATLMNLLPEVLTLRASEASPIVASAIEAMRQESRVARPGGVTLMTRLADVVIIHAIRDWLERTHVESGWLAALRDPQIGRLMADLHQRPDAPWSLTEMARVAGLSRSRFSERFSELLGVAPMHYLTTVRMHRASDQLQSDKVSIAELAQRFGYDSEPAFARAFKRHMGVPPGRVRRDGAARRVSI